MFKILPMVEIKISTIPFIFLSKKTPVIKLDIITKNIPMIIEKSEKSPISIIQIKNKKI
jgi:hypothetical protein